MTAEALNTITRPIKTRIAVTVNIQRSTLTRLAMGNSFHHGDTGSRSFSQRIFGARDYSLGSRWLEARNSRLPGDGQRLHEFFERASAMFVILELVETGAGGSE